MVRFLALFSMALIGGFFWVGEFKAETRQAKSELAKVEREIAREQQKIRVLKAEWAHRTEPATLRRLAEAHLGLSAVRIEQIANIEDVPYLGMDLYEDQLEATPVDYASAPRRKPGLVMAEQQSETLRHASVPQVEYMVAGPGFARKAGGAND